MKQLICPLDIPCDNIYFFFQPVKRHTAPGHIRAVRLHFQPGQMSRFRFRCKQNRNNPRTCAQIQHPGPILRSGKAGQKHRVHSETKTIRVLYDTVPVSLQIVYSFIFFQNNIPLRHCRSPIYFPDSSFFSSFSSAFNSGSLASALRFLPCLFLKRS